MPCQTPYTRAKPIYEGCTYHVTRRCHARQLRLLPDPETTQILTFCLAYAAAHTGVDVHAVCMNTNHEHLVVSDPHARLPDFMQVLNSLIARALNARDHTSGHFWDSEGYSATLLSTEEALLNALAYVTTNPVKDNLVSTPGRYPGLNTLPSQVGTTLKATRPLHAFFGGNTRNDDPFARPESSSLPTSAPLCVALPLEFFAPDQLHRYKQLYQQAVDAALDQIYATRAPRPFMGRTTLLAQDRFTSAGPTPATFSRPASTLGEPDLHDEARDELRAWRDQYVLARDEGWSSPPTAPTFPTGAWLLPRRYDAPLASEST